MQYNSMNGVPFFYCCTSVDTCTGGVHSALLQRSCPALHQCAPVLTFPWPPKPTCRFLPAPSTFPTNQSAHPPPKKILPPTVAGRSSSALRGGGPDALVDVRQELQVAHARLLAVLHEIGLHVSLQRVALSHHEDELVDPAAPTLRLDDGRHTPAHFVVAGRLHLQVRELLRGSIRADPEDRLHEVRAHRPTHPDDHQPAVVHKVQALRRKEFHGGRNGSGEHGSAALCRETHLASPSDVDRVQRENARVEKAHARVHVHGLGLESCGGAFVRHDILRASAEGRTLDHAQGEHRQQAQIIRKD